MGVRDRGRKYSIVEVEWHRKWLAVKLIKNTGDGWLWGTGPYVPPEKLITVMINNIQANENCDSLSTWDEIIFNKINQIVILNCWQKQNYDYKTNNIFMACDK